MAVQPYRGGDFEVARDTKSQELDDYRSRFEDLTYSASYANSSSGSLVGIGLAQLDIFLGRIVSMLEVRAVEGLLSQIPSGGVLLDVPCGHGKLRSLGVGRFRILGIDASRPLSGRSSLDAL